MSGAHDPAHEEQLFALCGAAGDAPGAVRAAFESSALAHCADCRELVAGFAGTERVLAGVAAHERALEHAARHAPPAPGEERVRRALAERAARTARGTQLAEAPRRRGAWRAVAAILIVGLLAQTAWLLSRPRPSPPLGNGLAIELVSPVGNVARFDVFTWRADLPPGCGFRVRVHGERDDGALFERESPWLSAPRWEPDASDAAAWPAHLRWEVEILGPSGDTRGTAVAETRRSGT